MALLPNITVRRLGALGALPGLGAILYLAATFDTFPRDEDALTKFQGFRNSWLDGAAVVATSMAAKEVAILSVLAASLSLWLAHRKADAAAVLLVLLASGINEALRVLVDRPRPEFSLLTSPPDSAGFPSGHAVFAFVLYGLLIVIVGELIQTRRLRIAVQGLLGLMILACGASRVYLGVHWPSDVLGGYLVGGAILVAILWLRKTLLNRALQ